MITTADGHNLYFYLEGVRIPPLNIAINISNMVNTATVSIFAHESAKDIKDGSIGAIFYSKSGLSERRLLYFGFLNTKNYSKQNGAHAVTLTFVSRMAYLSRIHIGIVGNGSYSSCSTQATATAVNYSKEVNSQLIASSMGSATVSNVGNLQTTEDIVLDVHGNDKIVGRLKDGVITTQSDHAVSKTNSRNIDDGKTSIKPFGSIIAGVERTYPVKSIMDRMIKEACHSSGVFNKIAYDDRYFYKNYLSEMPGGWAEYFFGDSAISTTAKDGKVLNKTQFLTVFIRYLQSIGTTSTVTDVYFTLLGILMMEAWEIPGLVDAAQMMVPESIHTDIPMCNIIWPDMCKTISYTEDSSKRVSRLVLSGAITDTNTGGESFKAAKELSATGLGIYPATDQLLSKDTVVRSYNNIVYTTEIYNGSTQRQSKLPMAYLRGLNAKLLTDLAQYAYVNASTNYSSCQVSMHFAPELIPGINTLVNDGMWKGVGKIVSMRHTFAPGSPATTDLVLSNYRTLDEYTYEIPDWYSKRYSAENVNDLYYTKFGVNSIGGFLRKEGTKLSTLVGELNEMYEATSVRTVMAEKLSQRYFMSQDEFFSRIKATATQQDAKGVIIYQEGPFKAVNYDAYTKAGDPKSVTADRQKAVVTYLKNIYGRPAVKV